MLCSTLVLVLLCRYLHAVCTALAFVPLVHSSGYCTFCSLSYSSTLPLLLMLCFSVVHKLLETPLYSSLNIYLSNSLSSLLSSSQSSFNLPKIWNKNDSKGAAHKLKPMFHPRPVTPVVPELTWSCMTLTASWNWCTPRLTNVNFVLDLAT